MAVYKVRNQAGNYRNENAEERLNSYVTSRRKTRRDGVFGGSVNPEIAALSMKAVTEVYRNDAGLRLRHSILSFDPHEGISPDNAQQIARQACNYYADKYQIIAAIHEDREHLHIHFVMNTTNYNDGSKYRGNKKDYYDFLKHLNRIVKPYGINVKAVKNLGDG